MTDFHPPDWNKDLDVEKHLAAVPAESTVKGIFFRSALEHCKRMCGDAPGRERYNPLANYPTRELAEVLAEAAQRAYPSLSLRKGLRHLGSAVFPGLRETNLGKIIFGVMGLDLSAAFKMTSRTYKAFSNNVSAELQEKDKNLVVVQLRKAWTYPDCYHVGIFEGAIKAFGKHGMITIREHSACDTDLQIYYA